MTCDFGLGRHGHSSSTSQFNTIEVVIRNPPPPLDLQVVICVWLVGLFERSCRFVKPGRFASAGHINVLYFSSQIH